MNPRKFWLSFAVAIFVLISVVILFPRQKNQESTNDLRGLHAAASLYLQKNGEWPQPPVDLTANSESDFFDYWFDTLAPYGATREMWIHSSHDSSGNFSYIPTQFSPGATTPFRFNQPWFISRGSYRGKNLIILPDGAVIESRDLKSLSKPKP